MACSSSVRVLRGLFLPVLLAMPAGSGAGDTSPSAAFRLMVFGCYMDVPGDFILNGKETKHLALFRLETDLPTRIVVKEYDGPLEDVLVVEESRQSHGLTIERMRFRRSTGSEETDRVTRIHDGVRAVEVYAAPPGLVDGLVTSCLGTMDRS